MDDTQHSFIVPAFGDSPFLEDCLESLRTQTTKSRVVVSTSTPSAHIASACRRYGATLRVNPQRRNIGSDWNWALRRADTRYVTFAHQDDVYKIPFLARTLDLFRRHPEGALCFTGYQEIGDDGAARSSRISRVKHALEAVALGRSEAPSALRMRFFLSFGNPLPCSAVTLDRKHLPDFAFSTELASNLDWDAWWRLLSEGRRFLHAPERLVGRRHNGLTETSRLIRDGRRACEDREMFRRIWPAPIDAVIAAAYRAGY